MGILRSLRNWKQRAANRHPLEVLKHVELTVLGRNASTHCRHHPSHVLIELTTRCNLRCRWCNQSDPKWQKQYGKKDMPFELFEKIVKDLKGSRVLLLYNIGESLMYPRILDAIRVARQVVPEVRRTSNGLLLTADWARDLEQAGLTQLNVSVDSPEPALMKRIRAADLDAIERNLMEFGAACEIPVVLWSVISGVNAESLKELPNWAARVPAVKELYFQLQNGVDGGEAVGLPALRDEDRFRRLQEDVSRRCSELGLKTNIASLPFYAPGFHEKAASGICKAPFTQLVAINVDGQLAPCCSYATKALGDVGQDGFAATWNGSDMKDWRQRMLDQRYPSYCSEWCGYKEHHDA